jgi:hypothetical protein
VSLLSFLAVTLTARAPFRKAIISLLVNPLVDGGQTQLGYTIEYTRQCFKLSAGTIVPETEHQVEYKRSEADYFLFVKSGCNNVSPRPKNWHLEAHGWNYSIIQKVCEMAGYTECGMLKMDNGFGDPRDITPEDYLALYRKTIAEAKELTVERLQKHIGIKSLGFSWLKDETVAKLQGYHKEQFEKLLANFEREPGYTSKHFDLTRPFNTLEDFFLWLDGHWVIKEMQKVGQLLNTNDGPCIVIRSTQDR